MDIKRLRVLVYLPNALTELAFRQAVGRVVRTARPDDDTRAYVVMPSFETFEQYARRVEDEMPPSKRGDSGILSTKRCPDCHTECVRSATECPNCGYEFPKWPEQVKTFEDCGALNPVAAKSCHACERSFEVEIVITLDEALRTGTIIRGVDRNEGEVQAGESIAPTVWGAVLKSGDERLVRVIQALPEESWARLKGSLESA